jgi:hypothetical protein
MLSSKITDHDNFTGLPATAQALYLHLIMSADDDGFCAQTNTARGKAHARQKDLDALVSLNYLIRFDSGVYAIKHWRMQNAIRLDRYHPTEYQEEFSQLSVKPNGAYTTTKWQPDDRQTDNQMADNGCQNDNQAMPDGEPVVANPQPEVRLGKDRLGKVSINNTHNARARTREEDDFEAFWNAYPRKSGDIRQAFMVYQGVIDKGIETKTLIEAIKAQTEGVSPEDLHFLPSAEKWLRNRGWESRASLKSQQKEKKPKQIITAAEYKPPVNPTSASELWDAVNKI